MKNINKYVEHTLLKQDATQIELDKLIDDAKRYDFLGVCINPNNVKYAKEKLKNTNIKVITVIGFPLGANKTEIKVQETIMADLDGADEMDMVINVSALKNQNYDFAMEDIKAVVNSTKKPIKVIIETDLLTEDEIKKATELTCVAGAKFVKTSTGFVKGGIGAREVDVKIMKKIAQNYGVEVKASGGIKTYQDAKILISAGATRLGTSSGVKIVEEADIA